MREKVLFVGAAKQAKTSFRSLCAAFGIAPKTGYKWLHQFERRGVEGLAERSRRPRNNPRAVPAAMRSRLIALREQHPTWGPRKLVAWLDANEGGCWELPAPSTVGALLKREGFVKEPRESPRHSFRPATQPLRHATRPNRVWSMDFKGWYLLGDRTRCSPLTITDNFSRFLLRCRALDTQHGDEVWKWLTRTLREFGMPDALRIDNGQPWSAPKGQLHLTTLSVKILRLGIAIERIAPGKPQQNGRHERFHRTLLEEAISPPSRSLSDQQRRFDRFRLEFNDERPHEALGQRPPASRYTRSKRVIPSKLPRPEYDSWFRVQRVDANGKIRFDGSEYFVTTALDGDDVGLLEVEEGCFEVWFCTQLLGRIHREHPKLGLLPAWKVLPMSSV